MLAEEYQSYRADLKKKIASLTKNDKRWWQLNRELLNHKARVSSIPPLRDAEGKWITDSKLKANCFASVWQAKCVLPAEPEDPFFGGPHVHMESFIALRSRQVMHELTHIDCKKATGPDRISAVILRRLATVIAIPLTILARRILQEGVWPECWKLHHLVPIYKRHSAFLAKNYRGIHLTCQMAKIVERVISTPLVRHLQCNAFGNNQWAFTKGRSARDLIALCISNWILRICTGSKVGLFLGDIAGAFDRVYKNYLMSKLYRAGVGDIYLNFLNSYLEPRIGKVTVEGVMSDTFEIADTVFQGSVLGPALWNCFFADVSEAGCECGGEAELFADDLNIQHTFHVSVDNELIFDKLKESQAAVHRWGRRNRVTFEPSKEQFVIIHCRGGEGEPFTLLGNHFDPKLIMDLAIQHILHKNRPKITAMLRTRGLYSVRDMIIQYKTHIWGHSEYQNASICHVSPSLLLKLDAMQRSFLHGLHLTEETAFLDHNFLPPCTRRDIAILGLIHKRVIGLAHSSFEKLLPWRQHIPRWEMVTHNKQLLTVVTNASVTILCFIVPYWEERIPTTAYLKG